MSLRLRIWGYLPTSQTNHDNAWRFTSELCTSVAHRFASPTTISYVIMIRDEVPRVCSLGQPLACGNDERRDKSDRALQTLKCCGDVYSSDGAWPAHFFCFFWAVLAAITVACLFSFFAGASRKYISSTSFLTGTLFTKIGTCTTTFDDPLLYVDVTVTCL